MSRWASNLAWIAIIRVITSYISTVLGCKLFRSSTFPINLIEGGRGLMLSFLARLTMSFLLMYLLMSVVHHSLLASSSSWPHRWLMRRIMWYRMFIAPSIMLSTWVIPVMSLRPCRRYLLIHRLHLLLMLLWSTFSNHRLLMLFWRLSNGLLFCFSDLTVISRLLRIVMEKGRLSTCLFSRV